MLPTPRATYWRRDNYRSFNALNDTNPRMMEIIQKRTMTLGSGQPFSSKLFRVRTANPP
jgi:hypothetical protein